MSRVRSRGRAGRFFAFCGVVAICVLVYAYSQRAGEGKGAVAAVTGDEWSLESPVELVQSPNAERGRVEEAATSRVGIGVRSVTSEAYRTGSIEVQVKQSAGSEVLQCALVVVQTPLGATYVTGEVGADRRCVFQGVVAGKYAVTSLYGGYAQVEVEPNETVFVELLLPRGDPVVVSVVDRSGNPIPDAEVCLSTAGTRGEGELLGRTDQWGRRRISPAPIGRLLCVRAPGFEPSAAYPIERSEAASEELVIVLREGGRPIEGQVIAIGTDLPLAGARVEAEYCGNWPVELYADQQGSVSHVLLEPLRPYIVTDVQGLFRFEAASDMRVVLRVALPGFAQGTFVIDPGSESTSVVLPLQRAVRLSGTASIAGAPAAGVLVTLECDGEHIQPVSALTGPHGEFAFRDLQACSGTLTARGSRGAWGTIRIRLEDDKDGLVLELQTPAEPALRLRNGSGGPLVGWSVTSTSGPPPTQRKRSVAHTDDEGHAWIAASDDMDGWLHVWHPDGQSLVPFASVPHRTDSSQEVVITSAGGTIQFDSASQGSSSSVVRVTHRESGNCALIGLGSAVTTACGPLPCGSYDVALFFNEVEGVGMGHVVVIDGVVTRVAMPLPADWHRLPKVNLRD